MRKAEQKRSARQAAKRRQRERARRLKQIEQSAAKRREKQRPQRFARTQPVAAASAMLALAAGIVSPRPHERVHGKVCL